MDGGAAVAEERVLAFAQQKHSQGLQFGAGALSIKAVRALLATVGHVAATDAARARPGRRGTHLPGLGSLRVLRGGGDDGSFKGGGDTLRFAIAPEFRSRYMVRQPPSSSGQRSGGGTHDEQHSGQRGQQHAEASLSFAAVCARTARLDVQLARSDAQQLWGCVVDVLGRALLQGQQAQGPGSGRSNWERRGGRGGDGDGSAAVRLDLPPLGLIICASPSSSARGGSRQGKGGCAEFVFSPVFLARAGLSATGVASGRGPNTSERARRAAEDYDRRHAADSAATADAW
jgi:hypothetical protein